MSFSAILRDAAARRGMRLPPPQHPEPLAGLDYADELGVKRDAIEAAWKEAGLAPPPEPILAAPLPRGYRTTTKRRAVLGAGGSVALTFPGSPRREAGLAPSLLDAPEHTALYGWLLERLARPSSRPLARVVNWVIVRGDRGALALILNLRAFDGPVVHAAKTLAAALQEAAPLGVQSASLYLDPTRSDYYLEARRPRGALSFKRLFGPESMQVDVAGRRLRMPPTVFSQVNGAMLGLMVETAAALLAPLDGTSLLDLYCGYGLFTLTAGAAAAGAAGVDSDGPAIQAARANAVRLRCADRVRFVAGRIDGPFLASRVRPASGPEAVLLDPPRSGTIPGVADAVARRAPVRVVHICCGADEIPREVSAWSRAGYALERAVPLDLFAGTEEIETMMLFTPRRNAGRAPRSRPPRDGGRG